MLVLGNSINAMTNIEFVQLLQCAGRAKRRRRFGSKHGRGIQSGVALRLATPLHKTARRVTFSAASSW
ncbi:MAG: hypothetical protein ABR568_24285, partial [Pyrinomonadaceae bacterium]